MRRPVFSQQGSNLSLPVFQVGQLLITGKKICIKYRETLPETVSVDLLTMPKMTLND